MNEYIYDNTKFSLKRLEIMSTVRRIVDMLREFNENEILSIFSELTYKLPIDITITIIKDNKK